MEPRKEQREFNASAFMDNFTSLFLEKLQSLALKLETDQTPEKRRDILDWCADSRDLIKYTKSVATIARTSGTLSKFTDLLAKETRFRERHAAVQGMYLVDLVHIRPNFPFQPLAFEDAMRILSNRTYTALPALVYRAVGGQDAKKQEAAQFREQFVLRRTADRDSVIAQANQVIRKKTMFAEDFPLQVESMQVNAGRLVLKLKDVATVTMGLRHGLETDVNDDKFYLRAMNVELSELLRDVYRVQEKKELATKLSNLMIKCGGEELAGGVRELKNMLCYRTLISIHEFFTENELRMLGFSKLKREVLSLKIEYSECFTGLQPRDLPPIMFPSAALPILRPIECEIGVSEASDSVIMARYSCFVPETLSGADEEMGRIGEFALVKKVATLPIPIKLMSDPCAILGLISSHIRHGRLLSIATILSRFFTYQLNLTQEGYKIVSPSKYTLHIETHGLTVADLFVTKAGKLSLDFSDARSERVDEFYHFCNSAISDGTVASFVELLGNLYSQALLQQIVSRLYTRSSQYFTTYYRLSSLLPKSEGGVQGRNKAAASLIKQQIKRCCASSGNSREEGQRLNLEWKRNLCKDSTIYLLFYKAVAADLLRARHRFTVLRIQVTPASSGLTFTLEFFKTSGSSQHQQQKVASSGEVERWGFPTYTKLSEEARFRCVDELGAYMARNAYNIELYSDMFEIAKYKDGVIHTTQLPMPSKPPQLNDNILLGQLQNYHVLIKEKSVEISSDTAFLPYIIDSVPTTNYEQYCPEYQWKFTRRGNTFEIFFIPGYKRLQADWKKPIISGSLTSMLQFLAKFDTLAKGKHRLVCKQNSVSPFNFNVSLHKRSRSGDLKTPLVVVKIKSGVNGFKFSPSIVIGPYLNHYLQPKAYTMPKPKLYLEPAKTNLLEILNHSAPILVELGYLLKGMITYPSIYPLSPLSACLNYLVRDYNRIEIIYAHTYRLLFEIASPTSLKIADIGFIKAEKYKKVPDLKALYAILQNYIDANELDELETTHENVKNVLQPRTPENPSGWVMEDRKARDHDFNLPLSSNEAFILDFKSTKYLQAVFKKLFDYLKCCKVQGYIRSSTNKPGETWETRITYGRLEESRQAKEGIWVNCGRSAEEDKGVQEALASMLSFWPVLAGRVFEVTSLFAREVRLLSIPAMANYIELCQLHTEPWRRIVAAYVACTTGPDANLITNGGRHLPVLEYRDISVVYPVQRQPPPQPPRPPYIFSINITFLYERVPKLRRVIHVFNETKAMAAAGDGTNSEEVDLSELKGMIAKYLANEPIIQPSVPVKKAPSKQ